MSSSFFNEDNVLLNIDADDWTTAVRIGGMLLVKCGAAREEYVEEMIETIKRIGPYVVIAPGIAIPHARPESGAVKAGLSLVTLKNPVYFGNKDNDPVKVVICLCAPDNTSHIKALAELTHILNDSKKAYMIINAESVQELLKGL